MECVVWIIYGWIGWLDMLCNYAMGVVVMGVVMLWVYPPVPRSRCPSAYMGKGTRIRHHVNGEMCG